MGLATGLGAAPAQKAEATVERPILSDNATWDAVAFGLPEPAPILARAGENQSNHQRTIVMLTTARIAA
jgi:hypothetical protein